MHVRGSQMTVDYSDMNPQVPGPLNSGRSGGIAGARVAFKALTSPDLDVNEGCFRPLDVVLPEGTMLSARPPAALGLWSIALPTVIDTILKALAPAVPHLIPAAHKGDMGGCSFFGFRDDGSRFLLMNIFGGGWGGRPNEDGEDASVSVCQGDVRNTPVELQEIKYPVLIESHALRADSGGAGRYRGGLGVELTYRLLQDCKANINLDRTRDPPWGLHGGKPARSIERIIRARRRHREHGRLEGDRGGDRRRRPRDVPHRRRRRLRRSRRARPRRLGARCRGGAGLARCRCDPATAATRPRRRSQRRRPHDVGLRRSAGKRLLEAMAEAGLDVLLLYGNAWQGDYLRYATDFGILEGQALALVARRRRRHALSRQRAGGRARRARMSRHRSRARARSHRRGRARPCDRLRNQRIGAAPERLLPRRIAARAERSAACRRDRLLDRLLMSKLDGEIDAMRRAAQLADEGYAVFRAGRPRRPRRLRAGGRDRSVLPRHGVDDNFQIIGVGGVEVRGMAPPSGKRLKRGDLVTTELTPCVDGYYAQICRTLVVGDASAAAEGGARALSRSDGGRHRRGARRRHRRRHRARRERRVPPRTGSATTSPANTPACAATAWACSPTPSRISWRT